MDGCAYAPVHKIVLAVEVHPGAVDPPAHPQLLHDPKLIKSLSQPARGWGGQ